MKLTLEFQDGTVCAFVGYVFYNETGGCLMAMKAIDTNEMHDGAVIKMGPKMEDEG